MALRNSHIFSAAHVAALLLPAALLLTGCGSARRGQKSDRHADYPTAATPATSRPAGVQPGATRTGAEALIAEARRWLGTPYRYGGAECGEGTDCSGLVMEVYRRVQGVKLPRSSREQMAYCTPVAENRVEPGDLMFFGNPAKADTPTDSATVNHVGLYIGNGVMIHASSSRGVIESSVAQGYWAQRFMGAGRVGQADMVVMSDQSDESDPAKRSKATKRRGTEPLPLDLLIDQKVDSIAQQAVK